MLRRVTRDQHQICVLAYLDRTGPVCQSQIGRAIQCADADRIDRRKACLDQQFDGSLVAEAYRILMRGGLFLYPNVLNV